MRPQPYPVPPAIDLALSVAIGFVAVLYLAAIGPYWNISPDSVTYVGVGRALAEGRGFEGTWAYPPLTSAVFAPVLLLLPQGYLVLNALATLILLSSLLPAFLLIRARVGRTEALLVVLMTLCYARFFHESTQLLSEPLYMLLSLSALWLLDWDSVERPGRSVEWIGGVLLVGAVLTRTVGVTLLAAVLLTEIRSWVAGRGSRQPVLAMAAIAGFAMVGWELWISSLGIRSNFVRVLLENRWGEGRSALVGPGDVLASARENPGLVPAVGAALANARFPTTDFRVLAIHVLGTCMWLVGFLSGLRRLVGLVEMYVVLYMLVVTYQIIHNDGTFRQLVPISPFLFLGVVEAGRFMWRRIEGRGARRGLVALGGIYLAWFLGSGMLLIAHRIPDEHQSPFGEYPIKRRSNYDVQRLAMRLGELSAPDDRFISAERDMIEVLSERRGLDFTAYGGDPAVLATWLERRGVSFILYDPTHPLARRVFLGAMAATPDRFEAIEELGSASLFRLVPGPRAALWPVPLPAGTISVLAFRSRAAGEASP